MTIGEIPTATRVRLSCPVFVLLGARGIQLGASAGRASVALDDEAIEALAALSGDGMATGQGGAADGLIGELTARGVLEAAPERAEGQDATLRPVSPRVDRTLGATTSLVAVSPVILRANGGGFERLDHEGTVLARLTPRQLRLVEQFRQVATVEAIWERQAGSPRPSLDEFLEELGALVGARLLKVVTTDDDAAMAGGRGQASLRRALALSARQVEATDRYLAEARAREEERAARTGVTRTRVVPVDLQHIPQLALGMVMSMAAEADGQRLQQDFEFVGDWMNRTVPKLTPDDPAAIYLFTNYIWTHAGNLGASAEVKRKSPGSVTIHGGPDTPKYEHDVDEYFRRNPHVDITVRGEGEATFVELLDALRSAVGDGPPDLSNLYDVPGICFRDGDRIVYTAERDRISDLDTIPSPYLTGLFDSIGDEGISLAVIETNRGCPYGCTYCDWGSATLSRIRKFSLDRVFAELEWCALHKVNAIYLADANFGIFERDVEIAQRVADLKEEYGYPRVFETNYAKNTVKHLKRCVEILAGAGITTQGILSLQSMDPDTLVTIKRSNIKLEKYEALANEFRQARLPLFVDVMMGLPGSTVESFRNDLQECVDREVRARVFPTQLLVNSPMNEPEYREANQIETLHPVSAAWEDAGRRTKPALVVASSSFTRDDYREMQRLRLLFLLLENFSVLRYVARYVRHETGIQELDFYRGFERAILDQPKRWPTAAIALEQLRQVLVPPASWRLFLDEVHDYVVGELGVADDAALQAIITTQHALLPARGRRFPQKYELSHDVVSWFTTMQRAKEDGHLRDWPDVTPHLRDLPPAVLDVDDPDDICTLGMGFNMSTSIDSDWELDAPITRPTTSRQLHL